jgi:hypothetical protein
MINNQGIKEQNKTKCGAKRTEQNNMWSNLLENKNFI